MAELKEYNETEEIALTMRSQGKTLQEIADVLGVSRQRVHQILGPTGRAASPVKDGMRDCRGCGKRLKISSFYKTHARCKTCYIMRQNELKKARQERISRAAAEPPKLKPLPVQRLETTQQEKPVMEPPAEKKHKDKKEVLLDFLDYLMSTARGLE